MRTYLMVMIGMLGLPAFAQTEFTSLDEVFNYADQHTVALKSASLSEEIASAGAKESKAYLFPSISAGAGYTDNITLQPTLVPSQLLKPLAEEGTFDELTFGKKYVYAAGITAQWDILNFQRQFASQTANILAEEQKVNTQKTKFNTYNQLASIYYSIVLTQEAISIYEENAKVSSKIYASAQEKYLAGVIREAELNAAEIKSLSTRSTLVEAQENLKSYYLQLQSLLSTADEIMVSDRPEDFKLRDTIISNTHPEILWQELEVEKSESILKQKKSLHLPTTSIFYQYNYNWAGDDFFQFSDVSDLPQQYLGLKLNIPIFQGFSTRQKVLQSKQELALQKLQLENTKLLKQKEDELLLQELATSAQRLKDQGEILALQKKNDEHIDNNYQNGLINLDERLDKYEDLLMMQNNYLQSLASFTLAKYKIHIRQIDFNSYE
ncbi:TolC family protein [Cyclobacterium marinum]|uniref:Outer membrane efflux protein n=1 Tax=Cyclobacterium marinum (strain ATCC 25205 / DSM 745 / LMG 13164 / NCIMB 1802) TaxID=880070 RepID=G0IUZ4_CYCMS|nr:TolC family protein [Cyclobacterium marinum]AEL26218.1 outer membrane efflux protein [Cyclobacterium marinum DSM 745]